MKKLLVASIAAMMLAACSSSSAPQEENQAAAASQASTSVEAALQECRQSVGETADRAAFDACMKSKGFERPAAGVEQPASAPASAPKL